MFQLTRSLGSTPLTVSVVVAEALALKIGGRNSRQKQHLIENLVSDLNSCTGHGNLLKRRGPC